MKKLYIVLTLLLGLTFLSGCDPETYDLEPEDILSTIDASKMVETLVSGRNNMSEMDQLTADIQSGDIMESEEEFFDDYYCSSFYNTVQNEDGTYTQTFSYYDYNYDIYETAWEVMYNGIDDDDDGQIDEDDEILLYVTDEMMDGIDNNYNGVIDEYFEMTPTHYVTYTMTYNEGTYTETTEDGVETITGSYFYEWTQVREPYNGQVVEAYECVYYDDDGYYEDDYEPTEEEEARREE